MCDALAHECTNFKCFTTGYLLHRTCYTVSTALFVVLMMQKLQHLSRFFGTAMAHSSPAGRLCTFTDLLAVQANLSPKSTRQHTRLHSE